MPESIDGEIEVHFAMKPGAFTSFIWRGMECVIVRKDYQGDVGEME